MSDKPIGLTEAVSLAKIEMTRVSQLIIDYGYTANDFKLILSRLIQEEMEYIERQHYNTKGETNGQP